MSEDGPLKLRVAALSDEAASVRGMDLRAVDGGPLPCFTAGAHIDLMLPGELSRSYSLTNPGDEIDRYTIAVNRDIASRGGSAHLCERVRIGDVLTAQPPRNNFALIEQARESVFFAGGIGITPILSMIRRLERIGGTWRLYYAARNRPSAAFVPQFTALEAAGPGRVFLHFDDEAGGILPIASLVGDAPTTAHLYCCGPTPMIETFEQAAQSRPPETVHVEHFTGTVEKPTQGFTIMLKRTNRELTVPAGKTIIEVLLEAGIRTPHACRQGVCGTCETRVLEGEPDHKDNVLSPREQASNAVMMICCSGAKSGRLVLDL